MALQYSSVVTIIYFSVNILFLITVGVIVFTQGDHKRITKFYFKDIWNQRKIYTPLIIHFYDTATDIGIIYNWYQLMRDEQTDPDVDYESVDMAVFFWSGVSFLIVYRLCLLCNALWVWLFDPKHRDGKWYHPLLVLCDLYIFVVVYESLTVAKAIMVENAQTRKINAAKKRVNAATVVEKEKLIEPADKQFFVQLAEAITESMPQIVLQSVFIIRSANDEGLSVSDSGSNVLLLMLSIIASLFSISNKFVKVDRIAFDEKAASLRPRASFPGCCSMLYIIRVAWRMCNITSRFCVFVLVWTIMGGLWLPIWTCFVWICWNVIFRLLLRDAEYIIYDALVPFVLTIGSLLEDESDKKHTVTRDDGKTVTSVKQKDGDVRNMRVLICKTIESVVAFALITIFGTLSFKCEVCSDPIARQIFKNENYRILIFWVLCLSSIILDAILLLILIGNDGLRETNIWAPSAHVFWEPGGNR
eukprot:17328_1